MWTILKHLLRHHKCFNTTSPINMDDKMAFRSAEGARIETVSGIQLTFIFAWASFGFVLCFGRSCSFILGFIKRYVQCPHKPHLLWDFSLNIRIFKLNFFLFISVGNFFFFFLFSLSLCYLVNVYVRDSLMRRSPSKRNEVRAQNKERKTSIASRNSTRISIHHVSCT